MRSRFQAVRSRRGIGKLEIIVAAVVVVIVASVAIALIMKGKQDGGDSREMQHANLMTVRNNLRQIALACQNHNDANRTFPPLYFSADPKIKGKLNITQVKGAYPWTVRLLPFVEESSKFQAISTASQKFTTSAEAVKIDHEGKQVSPAQINLPLLQSPHLGERKVPGNNNYVALSATRLPLMLEIVPRERDTGTDEWKASGPGPTPGSKSLGPDGMIIPDKFCKGQSMARMLDGASKTAVICESRELEKSNWYEPTQSFVCGFLPEDSAANGDKFYPYFDGQTWVPNPKKDRTALDYGPTEKEATRAYNAKSGDPLARTWGQSGGNPIGDLVVHAMGDGSVIMVSTDIDPKVYFALITCRGGENLDRPEDAKLKQ